MMKKAASGSRSPPIHPHRLHLLVVPAPFRRQNRDQTDHPAKPSLKENSGTTLNFATERIKQRSGAARGRMQATLSRALPVSMKASRLSVVLAATSSRHLLLSSAFAQPANIERHNRLESALMSSPANSKMDTGISIPFRSCSTSRPTHQAKLHGSMFNQTPHTRIPKRKRCRGFGRRAHVHAWVLVGAGRRRRGPVPELQHGVCST